MNISTKRNYIFRFTGSANSGQKQPWKVFCRKGILENFTSFTGKHPCLSLFSGLHLVFRPATLLKRDPNTSSFPWKMWNFENTYFEEHQRPTGSVRIQSEFKLWKHSYNKAHYVKTVQMRSFFWSVFSGTRTEYGKIRSISPYAVRMWGNTD